MSQTPRCRAWLPASKHKAGPQAPGGPRVSSVCGVPLMSLPLGECGDVWGGAQHRGRCGIGAGLSFTGLAHNASCCIVRLYLLSARKEQGRMETCLGIFLQNNRENVSFPGRGKAEGGMVTTYTRISCKLTRNAVS